MKFVHQKNNPDNEWALLTADEERSLAICVMDLIAKIWIDGEYYQNLYRIYTKKVTYGISRLTIPELQQLVECCDQFNWPVPDFQLDDQFLTAPILDGEPQTETPTKREYEWVRRNVRMIWREIWEQHDRLQAAADEFKYFWGDRYIDGMTSNDDYAKEQELIEERFWDEVDKVEREYECSRSQAIILVSDYMKRGDLTVVTSDKRERLGDLKNRKAP